MSAGEMQEIATPSTEPTSGPVSRQDAGGTEARGAREGGQSALGPRAEATSRRILEAAARCFCELGYQRTRLPGVIFYVDILSFQV